MTIPDKFKFTVPDSTIRPLIVYTAEISKTRDAFKITWLSPVTNSKRRSSATVVEMKKYLAEGRWVIEDKTIKPVNPNNLFSLEDL